MIKIAICDDSEKTAAILSEQVKLFLEECQEVAEIIIYTKSRLLQYDIQEKRHFDLVLSDIEMPDIDGMKLSEYIRKYLPEVLIIFITSHDKYMVDSFALNIFRYIPKRELGKRLPQALRDAFNMIHIQAEEFYVIESPQRMEKVALRKILYIQRDNKKNCILKMMDGSEIKVRRSLVQVHGEIGSDEFVFADRGLIVNVIHIKSIKNERLIMDNEERFLVSHTRLEQLKKELQKFWSKQL